MQKILLWGEDDLRFLACGDSCQVCDAVVAAVILVDLTAEAALRGNGRNRFGLIASDLEEHKAVRRKEFFIFAYDDTVKIEAVVATVERGVRLKGKLGLEERDLLGFDVRGI